MAVRWGRSLSPTRRCGTGSGSFSNSILRTTPTQRMLCGYCQSIQEAMLMAGPPGGRWDQGPPVALCTRSRCTAMRKGSAGCSSCGRSMCLAFSSVTALIGTKRWSCLRNLRELRAAGMACVCSAQNGPGSRAVWTSIRRPHADVSWTSLWTSIGRHLWTSKTMQSVARM